MNKNFSIALLCLVLILLSGVELWAKEEAQKALIKVEGLYCPFCSYGLEKQVKKLEGFKNVQINIKEGTAETEFKPGVRISEKAILTAVEDAGFDLAEVDWLSGKRANEKIFRYNFCLILSGSAHCVRPLTS